MVPSAHSQQPHKDDDLHSPYSPSGAEKYFNCSGSIASEAAADPLPESKYAKSGQHAHALGEHCLQQAIEPMDMIGQVLQVKNESIIITEAMAESVQMYYDYIVDYLAAHPTAILYIEKRMETQFNGVTVYGTADAIIIDSDTLIVIDYKSGRKAVDSKQNKQMAIYALLAMDTLGIFDAVTLVIVQPLGGGVKEWFTDTAELSRFRIDLDKAIERTLKRPDELSPGDHCLWCSAKLQCGAYKTSIPAYLDARSQVILMPNLKSLDMGELEDFVRKSRKFNEKASKYFEQAEELLISRLEKGEPAKKFSLLKKQGNLSWDYPQDAADALYKEHGVKAFKPLTPTQIKKMKLDTQATASRKVTGIKLIENTGELHGI